MVHAYCGCGAYVPSESIVLLGDGSYSWVCPECGEVADHVFPEEYDQSIRFVQPKRSK